MWASGWPALVVAGALASPVGAGFAGGADSGSDEERDGRSRLFEEAFGTDSAVSGVDGPWLRLEAGGDGEASGIVRFSFVRRVARESLAYQPEFSDDLRSWNPLPLQVDGVGDLGAGFERVHCRVVPVGGRPPGRFVRIRIERRPERGVFPSESEARDAFLAKPIAIEGALVDPGGRPFAGAVVTVDPDITRPGDEKAVVTGIDGRFVFEDLERRNVLLAIAAPGYRRDVIPVHLHVPIEVSRRTLAPVRLVPDDPGTVRFLFAGDTALGRRFVNPGASAEPDDPDRSALSADHPDALIQVSDPLPGALDCVSFVQPLFETADFPIVNLESPVLRNPATPHLTKGYAFHTLPETLGALRRLGIGYVTLGNNHVYDYLEAGVRETLANVSAAGIDHSGLGIDADSAFVVHERDLRGTRFAFFSACSVSGDQTPPGNLATETKGGAADLRDSDRVRAAIGGAVARGAVAIAQLHTGKEYSRSPSGYALDRMALAVESGADLVIAHHTHVAQGFEVRDGVLVAHCLGNFLFDQERLETLLGLAVRVDLRGAATTGATAVPIYLEDFRPRLVTGELADRFLRRIADVSSAPVIPEHGRGTIALSGGGPKAAERSLKIPVEIGPEGWAVVDLRRWLRADESLASMAAPGAGLEARLGRDLLLFGGMEETDIDDASNDSEASRWWRAGGAYRGFNHPMAGAVALYSTGTRRIPDVLAHFSVTADGVTLADGRTTLDEGGVAEFDAPNGTFRRGLSGVDGSAPFGSRAFFERLGNPAGEAVDVDALFLHDDGRVSFSTSTDYVTARLGRVKDGSVVTFDPRVPVDDPGSLVLLLDEDVLFPDSAAAGGDNNQDIDALHVDDAGRVHFSTTADAWLGGVHGSGLDVRDGDVVRYDPATGAAEIFLHESELFSEDADIDAFSFLPDGVPVFSTSAAVGLAGSGDRLVDGAVGRFDPATGTAATLLLQSDLFEDSDKAQADVDALHVEAHPAPPAPPDARPTQIAFRNRIRVEGDAENTPNKDVTALGYLWFEGNGPMALVANFYASFGDKGPETFGSQTLVEDDGGSSAAWRFFARDLEMPADDPDAAWPEADNARAIRLFLHHEEPADGSGLVGLDEMAVVSWEVDDGGAPVMRDLDEIQVFPGLHDRDFIRVAGPPGLYRLEATARRMVMRSGDGD